MLWKQKRSKSSSHFWRAPVEQRGRLCRFEPLEDRALLSADPAVLEFTAAVAPAIVVMRYDLTSGPLWVTDNLATAPIPSVIANSPSAIASTLVTMVGAGGWYNSSFGFPRPLEVFTIVADAAAFASYVLQDIDPFAFERVVGGPTSFPSLVFGGIGVGNGVGGGIGDVEPVPPPQSSPEAAVTQANAMLANRMWGLPTSVTYQVPVSAVALMIVDASIPAFGTAPIEMGQQYNLRVRVQENDPSFNMTFVTTTVREQANNLNTIANGDRLIGFPSNPQDPGLSTHGDVLTVGMPKTYIFPEPNFIYQYHHSWEWLGELDEGAFETFRRLVVETSSHIGLIFSGTLGAWVAGGLPILTAAELLSHRYEAEGVIVPEGRYSYAIHATNDVQHAFSTVADVKVVIPEYKRSELNTYWAAAMTQAISTGVGITTTHLGLPFLSAPLFAVEALAIAFAVGAYNIAEDPDANFTEIAAPEWIYLPTVAALPDSAGKHLAELWNEALTYQKAMGTSLGRYEGAKEAGNREWMLRQLEAARGYQGTLADLLSQVQAQTVAFIFEFVPELGPPILPQLPLDPVSVDFAQAQLLSEGLPPAERDILFELGFSAEDVSSAATITAGLLDYVPFEWQDAFISGVDAIRTLTVDVGSWIDTRIQQIPPPDVSQPGVTQTIVTSDHPAGSIYGQPVTFLAVVTPADASLGAATGLVQFQIDGTNAGTAVGLVGGSASFTTSSLHAGMHQFTATYTSDDTRFLGSQTMEPLAQPVAPAPLTITADDKTKVYGAAIVELTASYDGFVNGDTPASLTTLPMLATAVTAASHVGGYPITASGAASSDYAIGYFAGTFLVTPAPLGVTGDPKGRLYGEANPPLTATISGFVFGETADVAGVVGAPLLTTDATPSSPVAGSPYLISVAVGTLSAPDYYFTTVDGQLFVEKAHLTIKADDATKVIGAGNPALAASISGFVNGETLATSGVTGSPALSTTADVNSPVGTYPINVEQGTLSAANYDLTFLSGNLTVTYGIHVLFDQAQLANSGSTIPIKLEITDAAGGNLSSANITVTALGIAPLDDPLALIPPEDSGNANADDLFRPAGKKYIYNLNTTGLEPGIYVLLFSVGDDPTVHSVEFVIG
jgi:hypothetical protein